MRSDEESEDLIVKAMEEESISETRNLLAEQSLRPVEVIYHPLQKSAVYLPY